MTNSILVSRLLKFVDPCCCIGGWAKGLEPRLRRLVKTGQRKRVSEFAPLEDSRRTTTGWHLGRVAFFVRELREGRPVEPIEMDNNCFNERFGAPTVEDGYHRLIAHMVLRRRRIEVSYSGRVDTLEYLEGKRRRPPQDLA